MNQNFEIFETSEYVKMYFFIYSRLFMIFLEQYQAQA
jgi:hypothetical protein